MNKTKETYAEGFRLKILRDVTTKDIVNLCEMLEIKFNKYYDTNEFKFRPEPIGEGGIKVVNFPNKTDKMYKTLRIWIDKQPIDKWPWITETTFDEWKKNNEEHKIISKDRDLRTFLKAFYGAPIWTIYELEIVKECIENVGIQVIMKTSPKKKFLSTYRDV